MKVGDLVTIKEHPDYVGIVTNLGENADWGAWITIKWFDEDDDSNEFTIPLAKAQHIEVVK